ncbi:hypothetical protein ABPG74_019624 [Tetrahymena malaccensis]
MSNQSYSKINNLLKHFDIYGVPIRINFQSQEIHKTVFGSLISIFVMIMFGLSCYVYGMELFKMDDPIVITSEQYVKNPQRMDIDKTQQVIVMGFFDHKAQTVYDPSVIQVSASISNLQKVYNTTTQGYQTSLIQTNLRIRPCKQSDIRVDKLKGYFNQLTLNQYFCFDDNQEVYVEGDFSGDFYSKVDVYFSSCKNSTTPGSTVCKSQEYINNITSNLFFQAYMIDKIVNPSNLENPFDYQGFNIETQTSIFQSQQYVAFFENYYVQTDTGLLTKSVQEVRDFLYVESRSSNIYGKDGLLIQFTLRPFKNKQLIMQRRYMKFSDLFAQLGGILKVITLIGFVIAQPFAKLHLKKEITNSIFEFDFNLEKNEKTKNSEMNYYFDKQTTENNQKMNQTDSNKQFDSPMSSSRNKQFNSPMSSSRSKQTEQADEIIQLNCLSKQVNNIEENRSKYKNQLSTQSKQQANLNKTEVQDQQCAKFNFNSNQKASISESLVINSFNLKNSQNFVLKRKESEQITQKNQSEDGKESESQLAKDISIKQNFLERFKKILNPHKEKINLNLFEYAQSFLSCASSNLLQLKKFFILTGMEKVQNHLDIQYILQKLQEIEKLKQVILNEDQIRLFELLPRHVLHKSDLGNQKNNTNQFYDKICESYDEKIEKAHQSLINILKQRKKSQRDNQLIQLLDEQIYQTIKNTGLLSNSIDNLNQSYPNYPIDNNSFQQDEVNEYPISNTSKGDSNNTERNETIQKKIELLLTKLDVPEENCQITSSNYFNQVRNSKQNSLSKK